VTDTKRKEAIAKGAVPIGYGSPEALALTGQKRQHEHMTLPFNEVVQ
jgi:hypothetical protein